MEKAEIPGRIQMERFIPLEIFRTKSNTFRGIPFFSSCYQNNRNFLYHLFGLPVPGFKSRESEKVICILWMVELNPVPVFGTKKKKKYQYHLTEVFHQNFRTNGKRS